ncbi:hypothetical protein KEM48_000408 [Puccinia striiformis f. sp. tritici PST-130]|nr:hypothetical protein KEM48_000408 [Puccinia striiformis f. sp. tritici PST-130]
MLIVVWAYFCAGLATLDLGETALQPNYIDVIPIDGAISRSRYKMVIKMCEADLEIHGTLMDDWSEQISWLWTRCQPEGNRYYIAEWDQMIRRIRRGNPTEDQPQVEGQVEATVLEVDLDDGEDADVALIAAAEGDVSNNISNDTRNDGPDNVSNNISSDISNDASHNVSNDASHDVSNNVSNDNSNKASNDVSDDVFNNGTDDVSNIGSDDVFNNGHNNVFHIGSDDVSNHNHFNVG